MTLSFTKKKKEWENCLNLSKKDEDKSILSPFHKKCEAQKVK